MVNLRISSYVFILQKIDIKNKTDVYKIVFRPSDEELSNDDDIGSEFKMVPKSCKHVKIKIVSLRSIRTKYINLLLKLKKNTIAIQNLMYSLVTEMLMLLSIIRH